MDIVKTSSRKTLSDHLSQRTCDDLGTREDVGVSTPISPARSDQSLATTSTSGHVLAAGATSTSLRSGSSHVSDDHVKPSFQTRFVGDPAPPSKLWDVTDAQYLEKVSCKVVVMLTHIDPKNGQFEGRMKFHWNMRTLNYQERTEPLLRVPGIRLPRLSCDIEESRLWRNFDYDSTTTVAWQGTTVLSFCGHEMFEMHDFPYDRQVIDLSLFEFVWRHEKDTDRFFEEMKVVSLSTETESMMPEWACFDAIIEPRNVLRKGTGPTFCSRFLVKLRLERKERYYITQIFMVTYLITSCAAFTLALSPGRRFVGDRLAVLTSGLLTLVSFKYSIAHDLPTVPYPTFASTYLAKQVYTLVLIAGETVTAYKVIIDDVIDEAHVAIFEDILMYFLLSLWLAYFLYARCGKKRREWADVMNSQNDAKEMKDRELSLDEARLQENHLTQHHLSHHLTLSPHKFVGWETFHSHISMHTLEITQVALYRRLAGKLREFGRRLCDCKRKVKVEEDDIEDLSRRRNTLPKTLAL